MDVFAVLLLGRDVGIVTPANPVSRLTMLFGVITRLVKSLK